MDKQQIWPGERTRKKLSIFAVLFLFFTLGKVFAEDPAQQATSVFNSITDTLNAVQAKKIDHPANKAAKNFAENIQERILSIRSGNTDPGQSQASQTKKHAPMVGSNGKKGLLQALRDKSGDVRIWYGPKNKTPGQIKLKAKARKQGKVLMKAITDGISHRDRDEKTSRAFLHANGPMLRIQHPEEELSLIRYQEDGLKRRHLRYQQKYKDIPMWPAEANVHLDENGNVDVFNSSHVPTPQKLVTKPVVTSLRAIELAQKAVTGSDQATISEPELIIFTGDGSNSRLAWKMTVSVSLDAFWLVVIDAHRGTVLSAYNQVNTFLANGSGTDLTGTVRSLNLWSESGKYYLVDTSKVMYDNSSDPPAINTTKGAIIASDMANTALPNQAGESINYQEITSTSATSGWLSDGVSLSYCLSETYDYYNENHSRTSIDAEGSSILGFVRVGSNYQNAFWTDEYNAMFFGDAKIYAAALDVVAHELTHGITSFTCKLIYQDQSGALNEAFSDIFGEMVEARTNGSTDWINGTVLNDGGRDMKNPSSVEIAGSGYYYPSKMSQYYGRSSPLLQQFVNQDNGGVHINCTIITHAFYLLAEGLSGAIGKTDAAKIFYRAQTVHLLAGSQFIDARLASITSAEELFGVGSTQALKTAEAFDAVEVFDSAQTPEPPPVTPVSGDDSAVFVAADNYGNPYLAAYESANGGANWISYYPVAIKRPSVSGDGSEVFFVDAYNDACWIATDPSVGLEESCLGYSGSIASVSMSPDQQVYGFVLLDENNEPTNEITVVDIRGEGSTRTFSLSAPGTEGESVNTVLFAEAMDFTSDNRFLIYDAFNVFTLPDNSQIGAWSIYALDLVTEQIIGLINPVKDFEVGNPAVSQTTNHLITFEVFNNNTNNSTVLAMNLLDGSAGEVGIVNQGLGFPGYTGDDGAIVYQKPDSSTYTGYSLYRQTIQSDGINPTASPPELVFPAGDYGGAYGVVYRRGGYSPPVPNISVSPTSLSFGTVNTGESSTKSVTITNDGTGDLRIDSVSLSGANKADFDMSGSCGGQNLPASGTCTMNIVFSPVANGSKTASLSVQSDDPDTPTKAVSLSGTAETLDTDGDGMPDWWEIQYGLDKNLDDADLDKDQDGFTNIQEFEQNTLPNDSSSHPPRSMPWLLLLL